MSENLVVTRTITVWKPGQQRVDFESTATTWGQLKAEVVSKGFSFADAKAIEGNSNLEFIDEDALLPSNINTGRAITNSLIVLIVPKKNIKSGSRDYDSLSYKELKAIIKEIFADENKRREAKEHFGNYTQSTTQELRDNLKAWENVDWKDDDREEDDDDDDDLHVEVRSIPANKRAYSKKVVNEDIYTDSIDQKTYTKAEVRKLTDEIIKAVEQTVYEFLGADIPTNDDLNKLFAKAIKE